jgi:hypothetical protein
VCIRCRGNVSTEPLPVNARGIHIQIYRLTEGFIKYAVEMGSGATTYILSFINIDSDIQKLIDKDLQIHKHTDSMVI